MKGFWFFILLITGSLSYSETLEESLQIYKALGDFSNEELILKELEKRIAGIHDSAALTSLKRQIYIDLIDIPENLLFDSHISSLASDGDDIWIGSRSGDIARYSLSEGIWTPFVKGGESLAIRSVQSILYESEYLWFLSYGSVAVYSKRQNRFFQLNLPDNSVYRGLQSAVIMGQGLICGTQNTGLRRIRLDGHSVITQNPPIRNITYLKAINDRKILAGTEEDGLYILDQYFQPEALLENNRRSSAVRIVLGDESETLIAGSYGSGLFQIIKRNEKYDIVFLGTEAKWITDGIEISDYYCFSTFGKGLITLNKETLELHTFGISEGLAGLDISSITFVEPYVICAIQGQGLVRIHEKYFETP